MSSLRCQKVIEAPLMDVFRYITNPDTLSHQLNGHIEIKWQNPGIEMQPGAEFLYVMGRFGVEQPIRYRVDKFIPGSILSYQQLEGFLNTWFHTVKFEEVEKGTLVTDLVEYEVPFGLLGRVVDDFWWREDLKKILLGRLENIQSHFSN